MKTSNINVHDMLSVWSVEEVEKHISGVPGVESVTLNFTTGIATVRYDETRLEVADIKSAVRQRNYEAVMPVPSAVKPAEEKGETPAASPVDKLPEEKDKTETNPPAKAENPDVPSPNPTAVKPAEEKEETPATSPVVKPTEEKDKTETKPPSSGEKEEDNAGKEQNKME